MIGVGATFGKAIAGKAAKGSAGGTETERGTLGGAAPAMAESKRRRTTVKIKILKENKK